MKRCAASALLVITLAVLVYVAPAARADVDGCVPSAEFADARTAANAATWQEMGGIYTRFVAQRGTGTIGGTL
ncbi:hypothetical protein CU254_14860 [Amycolatopsis sp. AA4]|uniref:hypothetical protein n=1 Tax=Actinomycetes TaxID=1760 RepID=UPI0001B55026|nr:MULTISPECIES: hypothetical protein [Actinomycetes]ATY11597.1 hypothetical protein CU254_14860 [Amycolatopsis sp. AA4]